MGRAQNGIPGSYFDEPRSVIETDAKEKGRLAFIKEHERNEACGIDAKSMPLLCGIDHGTSHLDIASASEQAYLCEVGVEEGI